MSEEAKAAEVVQPRTEETQGTPPAAETVALAVHQEAVKKLSESQDAEIANLKSAHKLALDQALSDAERRRTELNNLQASIAAGDFAAPEWVSWLIAHRDVAVQLWSLVAEWQSITQPISDKDGLKSRVLVAVKGAKIFSALTPSPLDDEIVAFAENLLVTEGGLDIIADLLFQLMPKWKPANGFGTAQGGREIHPGCVAMVNEVFRPEHLDNIKMRATDRHIDWQKIIGMLPTIISVINLFGKL